MTLSATLQARELAIGYRPSRQPAKEIAAQLNLDLQPGQLVCLLGPNGAGKSTLMRTLAGMQPPLRGSVLLHGANITTLHPPGLAQQLSVVLTEQVDVGLLSAYALVALGRYPHTDWRGTLTAADELVIQQAIIAVGAEALASRLVSELSDGERQKVMIARALAQEPKLMILDEPTAFLDLPRRVEIMQILRRLAHEQACAILLSTHDLDLALRSADAIWLMADGQLHVGAPEDLVLNGTFGRAFASEGVTFNPLTGSFQIDQAHKGEIDVIGDGIQAVWTIRGLERIGYKIVKGGQDASMRVTCFDGRWSLWADGQERSFASLAALTDCLTG